LVCSKLAAGTSGSGTGTLLSTKGIVMFVGGVLGTIGAGLTCFIMGILMQPIHATMVNMVIPDNSFIHLFTPTIKKATRFPGSPTITPLPNQIVGYYTTIYSKT